MYLTPWLCRMQKRGVVLRFQFNDVLVHEVIRMSEHGANPPLRTTVLREFS